MNRETLLFELRRMAKDHRDDLTALMGMMLTERIENMTPIGKIFYSLLERAERGEFRRERNV